MKKISLVLVFIIAGALIAGVALWPRFKGALPVLLPPTDDIAVLIDKANEAADGGAGLNLRVPSRKLTNTQQITQIGIKASKGVFFAHGTTKKTLYFFYKVRYN